MKLLKADNTLVITYSCICSQNSPIHKEFEVLLVGGYGHGKKETVKSIETVCDKVEYLTVAEHLFMSICRFTDATLRLFNGPCVVEWMDNDDQSFEKASCDAKLIMSHWQQGFHAIVLVIYFPNLSQGQVYSLQLLKHAFGENVMKKHGVLLVTGADEFRKRMRRNGTEAKTIHEWCNEQDGRIKTFLDEFENYNRVVLFDMDNDNVKEQQVKDLINCMDCLPQPDTKYSHQMFIDHLNQGLQVRLCEMFF